MTTGYLVANETLRPLPTGSRLTGGWFTWAPPVGYIGSYGLVFLDGIAQLPVAVTIYPASEPSRVEPYIDDPRVEATVSGPFTVAGWAADPTAWHGTGIGAVHVWTHRRDVSGILPTFLGVAELARALAPGSRRAARSTVRAGGLAVDGAGAAARSV